MATYRLAVLAVAATVGTTSAQQYGTVSVSITDAWRGLLNGSSVNITCSQGARRETKEIHQDFFVAEGTSDLVQLNFGLWNTSDDVFMQFVPNEFVPCNDTCDLTLFADPEDPNRFLVYGDGEFLEAEASFAPINATLLPQVMPCGTETAVQQTLELTSLQQLFVAPVTGLLRAIELDVTTSGLQGINLVVRVAPANASLSALATTTTVFFSEIADLTTQITFENPLVLIQNEQYTVNLDYSQPQFGTSRGFFNVHGGCPAPAPASTCTAFGLDDTSPCAGGSVFPFGLYTDTLTGCLGECIIASQSTAVAVNCAHGCNSRMAFYSASECVAAACSGAFAGNCSGTAGLAAVTTGCSSTTDAPASAPGCPGGTNLTALLPPRAELNATPATSNPGDVVGVVCVHPDPNGAGAATTALICSAGQWFNLPAGSTMPNCPAFCTPEGLATAAAGLADFVVPTTTQSTYGIGATVSVGCRDPLVGASTFRCVANDTWQRDGAANNCTLTRQPTNAPTFAPTAVPTTLAPSTRSPTGRPTVSFAPSTATPTAAPTARNTSQGSSSSSDDSDDTATLAVMIVIILLLVGAILVVGVRSYRKRMDDPYDKIPMAVREQQLLTKQDSTTSMPKKGVTARNQLIELDNLASTTTDPDTYVATYASSGAAAPPKKTILLGGLQGTSATEATGLGAQHSNAGVSLVGLGGASETEYARTHGGAAPAGMSLGGVGGSSSTEYLRSPGQVMLGSAGGSTETDYASRQDAQVADNALTLRLASFYTDSSSSDPTSGGPAQSAAGLQPVSENAALLPKSDPALQRHSQLEPATFKLDDRDSSLRLKSTRRENPLYAKGEDSST